MIKKRCFGTRGERNHPRSGSRNERRATVEWRSGREVPPRRQKSPTHGMHGRRHSARRQNPASQQEDRLSRESNSY